jgi:hypothetical protein
MSSQLVAIEDMFFKADVDAEKLIRVENAPAGICNGSACAFVNFRGDGLHGWVFTNLSTTKSIRITTQMMWLNCVAQPPFVIPPGATRPVVFGPIPPDGIYASMCMPFQADFV